VAYPRKLHSLQLQEEIMPNEETKLILHLLAESVEALEKLHIELRALGQPVEEFVTFRVLKDLKQALELLQDEVFEPKCVEVNKKQCCARCGEDISRIEDQWTISNHYGPLCGLCYNAIENEGER
jgi:hypothetical protein